MSWFETADVLISVGILGILGAEVREHHESSRDESLWGWQI